MNPLSSKQTLQSVASIENMELRLRTRVKVDITARFRKKKPIVIKAKEAQVEKPPPEFEFDHIMTPTLHYVSFKEEFTKKIEDFNPLKNLAYIEEEEVKKPIVSTRMMNKNEIWK